MSVSGALIYEGEVLYSNPATHSARVRVLSSTEGKLIECCVMMPHGDGTGKRQTISLPAAGTNVVVLVDSADNGVILGCLPKASLGIEPSAMTQELDPVSAQIRDTNFRGAGASDILPGDIALKSNISKVHLSDNELTVCSGKAKLEMSDMFGHSHLHTAANSVTHKNSLFTYKLLSPGGTANPELKVHAFTQNPKRQSSLEHLNDPEADADLSFTINTATPLDINYQSNTAAISIDSTGKLRLKGSSVEIDAGGFVQKWGEDVGFERNYLKTVAISSDADVILQAGGTAMLSSGTTYISSNNATTIDSGGTLAITASGSSQTLPIPGIDQSLTVSAPFGGIDIKAGSYFPTLSSITKPGVRIQSEGGGDIHINSSPALGSGFTTGAVVIDAATPFSTSKSSGPGGYGIVLNSPLVLMGGLPGVSDTPAGLPGIFLPPVVPVVDSGVKHFPHMAVYNTALVAGISAALTAAFPPLAAASVPIFNAAITSALIYMGTPPLGRSLTCNSL